MYGGEEGRGVYMILEGKPKENRPSHRWEDNIKMDLQEVGWEGCMDWIDLVQDRDSWRARVDAVRNLRVP
jgi:hypothetical protein